MKFSLVYKIFPCLVLRSVWVPCNFRGMCLGPLILIKKSALETDGLIEHEKTHYRQMIRYFFIGYAFMYFTSWQFRLKVELEGYKEEIKLNGITVQMAADTICRRYGIPIGKDEVIRRLTD